MGAKFAVGDRVKVTLEGEVTRVHGSEVVVSPGGGRENYVYTDSATIEKVEPPAEVFQPGDVVRSKRLGRVYSLGKAGRIAHSDGSYLRYGCPPAAKAWEYTSERFERVEVG